MCRITDLVVEILNQGAFESAEDVDLLVRLRDTAKADPTLYNINLAQVEQMQRKHKHLTLAA